MDNLDQAIKTAKEERDDLIQDYEALLEKDDFSGEDKAKAEELSQEIESKNEYIGAKQWQAQQRASKADPYDKDEKPAKEFQQFSWSKFIMSSIPGMDENLSNRDRDFYDELSRYGKKQANRHNLELSASGGGKVVPFEALKAKKQDGQYRADLTIGTEGGDITFDEDGGFIDQLNEAMVLTSVGADFMTGLTGDVKFPRETNAPTITWEGETDANAESTPTFDNVAMSPKRAGTYIDVSTQTLLQTNPSIDARINRQLISAARRAIETAGINGSGASNQPEGILQTSGIGSNDVGTNGGAQTWGNWVDNESSVANANADMGNLAYLTNSKVRGQAKQTIVDSGSGRFIWPVNATEVNGYQVGVSNLVPDDLTKGTGTALSALIFGNFNDLVIGQWGGLEVLVDPYTQATSGMTRLVLNFFVDVAVLRAGSFSATQDIDTTA